MNNVRHETVYFSGCVQGVGFRYTTLQLARRFAVAGYVRNLPDGRVLLEAEGEAAEIDGLVRALGEALSGHIEDIERRAATRLAQFDGFTIR